MLKTKNALVKNGNNNFFIPALFIVLLLLFSILIFGCSTVSSSDDKVFEERYLAAQKKYEMYLKEPVSGKDVLDLIDNWNENDFKMTVEDSEGSRYCVSDLDRNNTIFKYWDKESIYYIDPNAFYKGSFVIYQSPRKKSNKAIAELYFSLADDATYKTIK